MIEQNRYIDIIADKLKKNKSIKNAYLFGSYASGNPDNESDIDLLIILNRDGFLAKYDERIGYRKNIAKSLYEVNKEIAIDILVYTQKEWEKILKSSSSFHNEIADCTIKIC